MIASDLSSFGYEREVIRLEIADVDYTDCILFKANSGRSSFVERIKYKDSPAVLKVSSHGRLVHEHEALGTLASKTECLVPSVLDYQPIFVQSEYVAVYYRTALQMWLQAINLHL